MDVEYLGENNKVRSVDIRGGLVSVDIKMVSYFFSSFFAAIVDDKI